MNWQLTRGPGPTLVQDCSLHMTSQPGLISAIPTLRWCFEPGSRPIARLQRETLAVEAVGDFWRCQLPDGSQVFFAALPWGRLPDLTWLVQHASGQAFYVPYRGWKGQQWWDGPMIWLEKGQVKAYVLPGPPAHLLAHSTPGLGDVQAWIKQTSALAWKQSLAFAFREKITLSPLRSYRIEGLQATLAHALALLGLRLAFPQVQFYCAQRPALLEQQWKRLCQNLNIATWLAPAQIAENLPFELANTGVEAFAPQAMASFFTELQEHIPVLPEKLLRSLVGQDLSSLVKLV